MFNLCGFKMDETWWDVTANFLYWKYCWLFTLWCLQIKGAGVHPNRAEKFRHNKISPWPWLSVFYHQYEFSWDRMSFNLMIHVLWNGNSSRFQWSFTVKHRMPEGGTVGFQNIPLWTHWIQRHPLSQLPQFKTQMCGIFVAALYGAKLLGHVGQREKLPNVWGLPISVSGPWKSTTVSPVTLLPIFKTEIDFVHIWSSPVQSTVIDSDSPSIEVGIFHSPNWTSLGSLVVTYPHTNQQACLTSEIRWAFKMVRW